MKKSILLIAIIAFYLNSNAYVFTSSNGYDVNIELTLDSLTIVSSGCADGWYNFGIAYSYDISFSGTNAPSSMWTLQANTTGDDGSTFMKLPNNGGQGGYTSSTITRRYSDCGTATPSSLGFDTIYLDIQGPGLSKSKFPLHVSALPVELIYFNAVQKNQRINLNWATASELNNDYFTIEKSTDGIQFDQIQTVLGAGTTYNTTQYSAYDEANNINTVYYRLKQTDYDGTTSYSPIVVVRSEALSTTKISVYPNPNIDAKVTVRIGQGYHNKSITILGANGQQVAQVTPTSEHTLLPALPRGFYFIHVTDASHGEVETMRLIQR
tara:strand:- start:98 stop:1069 length:972 start_codon:yes stop_codon:yes gene_type:complete